MKNKKWSRILTIPCSIVTLAGASAGIAISATSCSCSCSPKVAVTGISVSPTTLSLGVGEEKTLTATITPANASEKGITWTSSDTSIATVSGGKVTGKKLGSTTITAKTVDGGKTATCKVAVESAYDFVLNLDAGKTAYETGNDTDTLVQNQTYNIKINLGEFVQATGALYFWDGSTNIYEGFGSESDTIVKYNGEDVEFSVIAGKQGNGYISVPTVQTKKTGIVTIQFKWVGATQTGHLVYAGS